MVNLKTKWLSPFFFNFLILIEYFQWLYRGIYITAQINYIQNVGFCWFFLNILYNTYLYAVADDAIKLALLYLFYCVYPPDISLAIWMGINYVFSI